VLTIAVNIAGFAFWGMVPLHCI